MITIGPGTTLFRWRLFRAATFVQDLLLTDEAGAALDLTGGTVRCLLGRSWQEAPLLELAPGAGIVLLDAAGGRIRLVLEPALTAALPPGPAVLELLATDAAGLRRLQLHALGTIETTLLATLGEGVVAGLADGMTAVLGGLPDVSAEASGAAEFVPTVDPARALGRRSARRSLASLQAGLAGELATAIAAKADAAATAAALAAKADAAAMATALALLAPLASPALTGTPTAPTPPSSDGSSRIATMAAVKAVVAELVASSPAALDTLNELAAALGNDAGFAATMTNALAAKAPLASPAFTGLPTAPTPASEDASDRLATMAALHACLEDIAAAHLSQTKGTAKRTQAEINLEYITVDDFGADPTGAADSTAAINAAFAYLRTLLAGSATYKAMGGRHYCVRFSGTYLCLGSINATAIAPRSWGIRFETGSIIVSKAAGKVAFDMYRSRFCKAFGISIYGHEDAMPAVGLLVSHGLNSSTGGCGEHLFVGCEVNGFFGLAALYDYAAEETVFLKSFFRNGYDGAGADQVYAGIFTAYPILGIASDFQTILVPPEGEVQSFNGTLLLNTEFCRTTTGLAPGVRGLGPALLLYDTKSLRGTAYVRQSGAGHPAVTLRSSGRLRNLRLDFIVENNVAAPSTDFPNYLLLADDPTVTFKDIEITDHQIFGRALIRFSATTLYVTGLKLRVPCANKLLLETEYAGSDVTLMPLIRGFDLLDTSNNSGAYTTPSIDLDRVRRIHGIIQSQDDGLLVTTLSVSRFAGIYIASQGTRIFSIGENQAVSTLGAVVFRSNTVRVTGNGSTADVVARLTRPGVLPDDTVDIHCMTELTFSHTGEGADAGNIRMASGANKVCPINSKVRFWWHNGANVWRDWQP